MATTAFAKPMAAPTLAESLHASPTVLVADYQQYRKAPGQPNIGYFQGPLARYRVVKVLKGAFSPQTVEIRYDFTDGSACLAEEGWQFTPAMMPAPGSRWILLLAGPATPATGAYRTTRGTYGRKPWSKALEGEIKAWLNPP